MEFTCKYGIWELLRHEKIPETHVLAILLTGNALLLNGKKTSCLSSINKLFQNFKISGDVHHTDLMANFTLNLSDTALVFFYIFFLLFQEWCWGPWNWEKVT